MNEHTVVRDLRYFSYLLGFTFTLAKLTGHFDYSWWIVFSPVWGIYVGAALFLMIAAVVAAVGKGVSKVGARGQ